MKKTNNKKLGSNFENDFARYLFDNKYWVHLIAGASHTGSQPCDIIAVKDNVIQLFDCKTLSDKTSRFPIHRIEENQRLAYDRFKKFNNHSDFSLAILWKNNLYYIEFDTIDFNAKSIDMKCQIPKKEGFYEC